MLNVNEPKDLRGKNDVAKDYRGENTAWRSTGRYLWLAIWPGLIGLRRGFLLPAAVTNGRMSWRTDRDIVRHN